jgi:ribonuclease PH
VAQIAAVSVGIVAGVPLLDLAYNEDSQAEVDCNLVQTSAGAFVEIQGTAEGRPFSRIDLDQMLALGHTGLQQLFVAQRAVVDS